MFYIVLGPRFKTQHCSFIIFITIANSLVPRTIDDGLIYDALKSVVRIIGDSLPWCKTWPSCIIKHTWRPKLIRHLWLLSVTVLNFVTRLVVTDSRICCSDKYSSNVVPSYLRLQYHWCVSWPGYFPWVICSTELDWLVGPPHIFCSGWWWWYC
jgi:hypothetical protein